MLLNGSEKVADMSADITVVPGLGRPFTLGMLYDARHEKLIPGKFGSSDLIRTSLNHGLLGHLFIRNVTCEILDSIVSNWNTDDGTFTCQNFNKMCADNVETSMQLVEVHKCDI